MVNLFRQPAGEPGGLTAALLALLEHADPTVLNGLLRLAGIPHQADAQTKVTAVFPAPDGPPGAGIIQLPDFELTVAAQNPGNPFDPAVLADGQHQLLAVTLTGQEIPDQYALSWEAVDRYLLQMAEQFESESRTGFLIRQFRSLLADMGLEHFAGFDTKDLASVTDVLKALTDFHTQARRFFRHLGTALAVQWEGVRSLRESGAAELLAGYLYWDYAGAVFGSGNFLRVALHLIHQEVQISFWVTPAVGEGHKRLYEALTTGGELLDELQALKERPLLWLWSPDKEQQIPLELLTPADLTESNWNSSQAGLQRHQPLSLLGNAEAVPRMVSLAAELVDTLKPALSPVLH